MNGKALIGLAAALGGVAPNVLRIAVCLTASPPQDPHLNLGYLVGLLVFAGLGGAMALIWGERIPKRAFYLGIGLPALIQIGSNNLGRATDTTTAVKSKVALARESVDFSLLSSPAWAEESTTKTPVVEPAPSASSPAGNVAPVPQPRELRITFSEVSSDTQLVFRDKKGHRLAKRSPDWSSGATLGLVDVEIPSNAAQVEFFSTTARNSPTIQLHQSPQPNTAETLRLETKTDFASGLLKALGVRASDSIKVTRKE